MRKIIEVGYLQIAELLLCLFLTFASSCTIIKSQYVAQQLVTKQILSIGIDEQDYEVFMQKLQEMAVKPIAVQKQARGGVTMLWLTFEFNPGPDFLTHRYAMLTTGLVKGVN